MIQVTARVSPIRPEAITLLVEPGLTVAQIVRLVLAQPHYPSSLLPVLVVRLNEDLGPVAREHWHRIRPKAGTRVQIVPVWQDGGGGGKQTVFSALVVVATLAAYSIPGVGWIAGPIVGLAGSAALALFAPKPRGAGGSTDNPGQLQAAGFAGNRLAPYDQIPTVLGLLRAAPYLLTDSWARFNGKLQMVRGVIGLSGHIEWSDIRVNGALHTDAESVKIRTVNGDAEPIGNFPSFFKTEGRTKELGVTDPIGLELSKHLFDPDGHTSSPSFSNLDDTNNPDYCIPKFYSFVTRDSPHIICINLQFPAGLYESDATGGDRGIKFHIRMRLIGETAWRNLPELSVLGPRVEAFNFVFYISWETIFDDNEGTAATTSYHGNLGNGGGPAAWTSDSYFDQSSDIADHCIHRTQMDDHQFFEAAASTDDEEFLDHIGIFLNESSSGSTPWPKGRYEVQIKRSAVTNNLTGAWSSEGGVSYDPFLYGNAPGTERMTPRQKEMVDTVILHSVTYLWDEDALQAPDTAAIAFELRNTQVDHITAIAQSWTTVLTPSGWNGYGPTRNPAALFRHILTTPTLNKRPQRPELIDDVRLAEWYEHCENNGIYCDDIIESGSVDDALLICARAGDAVIARSGRSWRVAIDRDRTAESPLLVFSPRNVRNLIAERTFEEVPHAIRATFLDATKDYTRSEIFVYDDGQNANTATLVQSVDYRGITDQARVELVALRDLRKARLRRNTYSFETGKMSLAVDKGDLVGLATDALDGFWGWGYVTKVIRADGTISGVELDAEVAIPSGIDDVYTIENIADVEDILALGAPAFAAVTYRDASQVVTAQLKSRGRTRVLTFETPIADTALIDEQCHVAVSTQSKTYRRCIVENIQNGPDFTAKITLRDEAPAIFA